MSRGESKRHSNKENEEDRKRQREGGKRRKEEEQTGGGEEPEEKMKRKRRETKKKQKRRIQKKEALLYESHWQNQVDGLPPACTYCHSRNSKQNWPAKIGIFCTFFYISGCTYIIKSKTLLETR